MKYAPMVAEQFVRKGHDWRLFPEIRQSKEFRKESRKYLHQKDFSSPDLKIRGKSAKRLSKFREPVH